MPMTDFSIGVRLLVDPKRSAAAKKAWETIRRRYPHGFPRRRKAVGFYKDEEGRTRPITPKSAKPKPKVNVKVFFEPPIAVWGYDSSSSSRVYTVRLNKDGSLSCNCPSWIYRRTCKHIKDMEQKLNSANVGLSKMEQREFYHLYKKNLEKYDSKLAALRAAQAEFLRRGKGRR